MSTTTTDWLGNHVQLDDIPDTDLTVIQWCRPRHGSWRGVHVLDAEELRQVDSVLDELDRVRRDPAGHRHHDKGHYLRPDLAGSPLHLESLLADLLVR